MTDDLRVAPDAAPNQVLDALRDQDLSGNLDPSGTQLLPGLQIFPDPALEIAGQWRSPRGRLLEMETRPQGHGAWLGLHLSIPGTDLSRCGILGIACRTVADTTHPLRVCLRSGTENGFRDRFFDKHLLSRPQTSSHLDALSLQTGVDDIPCRAPWRELILFLPTESLHWSLIDLRFFIV